MTAKDFLKQFNIEEGNEDNITMCCLRCNCTKRNMTEQEFKMYKNNE